MIRLRRLSAVILSILAFIMVSAQPEVLSPANAVRLGESVRFGKGGVRDIAFSPGGRALAIASNTGVYIYNTTDFDQSPRAIRTSYTPTALAYSPDNLTLAVSDSHGLVHLIASVNGTERRTYGGHTDYVTDVAFSPDGNLVASSGFDMLLSVWRTEDAASVLLIDAAVPLTSVAFSPNGLRVAAGATDSTARIWNLA